MAKTINRKKLLRKQWKDANRRSGQLTESVQEQSVVLPQSDEQAVSLEDFLALPELSGLPVERLKTFYEEGIRTSNDFANWTEKELLALKGIGPATLKKLVDQGIAFKP